MISYRIVIRRIDAGQTTAEISAETLMRVQERLVAMGFLNNRPDGEFGPKARAALAAFQRSAGLSVSEVPDAATVLRLLAWG